MEAKYIGQDGVLGYEQGKVYKLVENPANRVRWEDPYKIIARSTGGGVNTYSTKEMFEKDWEVLDG